MHQVENAVMQSLTVWRLLHHIDLKEVPSTAFVIFQQQTWSSLQGKYSVSHDCSEWWVICSFAEEC